MQNEVIRNLRQQFYTFRNGILADTLRKAGDSHQFIFGLNLPQILDIARQYGKDAQLANDLWNDKKCREARLIAPILMPADGFTQDDAEAWCADVESIEVADILCHRLLRNLDYAQSLSDGLVASDNQMQQYLGYRLLLNLLSLGKIADTALLKAEAESKLPTASPRVENLLNRIIEECS